MSSLEVFSSFQPFLWHFLLFQDLLKIKENILKTQPTPDDQQVFPPTRALLARSSPGHDDPFVSGDPNGAPRVIRFSILLSFFAVSTTTDDKKAQGSGAPEVVKLNVKRARPKAASPNRQGPQQCQVSFRCLQMICWY